MVVMRDGLGVDGGGGFRGREMGNGDGDGKMKRETEKKDNRAIANALEKPAGTKRKKMRTASFKCVSTFRKPYPFNFPRAFEQVD